MRLLFHVLGPDATPNQLTGSLRTTGNAVLDAPLVDRPHLVLVQHDLESKVSGTIVHSDSRQLQSERKNG